jgi:hypothetical protein
MSKMRSVSKAGFLVSIALAAALSGCGRVDVNSPQIRGLAYVNMDDVVKHHPLYPQLAALDDAIAAINLAAAGPRVPRSAAEVAEQTKRLNQELRDAQDRANKTIAQKQQQYMQKEQQAIAAALQAAGQSGAGAQAGTAMSATSQQQAQAAAAQANRDFMAYQQSVISQDNAAINAVAQQLQKQADQKFRARVEQYQQAETDLSLRLSQQDASQRLALRTKLNNLAMDDATRKQLRDQLAALDKKEADQMNALRAKNAADLNAYRDQLRAETSAAVKKQAGDITAQTRAKIGARRDAVGAQIRSLGPSTISANLPPDLQKKLQQIHQDFGKQFQADAQKTVAEYNTTKADLDREYAALHGADVGATGAAERELTSLQKRKDDLSKQIQDQVQREAARIAKDKGFNVVFSRVSAAPGGYDLTSDLIHDVESLHE